jgi:hypothetical protein
MDVVPLALELRDLLFGQDQHPLRYRARLEARARRRLKAQQIGSFQDRPSPTSHNPRLANPSRARWQC